MEPFICVVIIILLVFIDSATKPFTPWGIDGVH